MPIVYFDILKYLIKILDECKDADIELNKASKEYIGRKIKSIEDGLEKKDVRMAGQ